MRLIAEGADARRRRRSGVVKAIFTHRLFWPLLILVALLIATRLQVAELLQHPRAATATCTAARSSIMRRTAPTLLVALGMTLVIATRGIDLSVGAVAAISGAAAATFIDSSSEPERGQRRAHRRRRSASPWRWRAGCGTASSSPSLGIQPIIATLVLMTAGRGVALLITDERIITAELPALQDDRRRLLARPAVLGHPRCGVILAAHRPADAAHRTRHAARVGRHQPGGLAPRRRAGPVDHLAVYIVCARCSPVSPG